MKEKIGKMQFDLNYIKNHDLVDYLLMLGHHPKRIRGINYWYLSPLRVEKTPSFKINRNINRWYDHGIGKGGNLIDFGMLYFKCDFIDFLNRWELSDFSNLGIVQPQRDLEKEEPKLIIKKVQDLTAPSLFSYLKTRGILFELGKQFCKQVDYQLGDRSYYGLGFKNDSGGYELRNPFYKYASAPKDITTIIQGHSEVNVFEGFMDFLSYLSYQPDFIEKSNFLILNGLGFFERSKPLLESHKLIHLFLDRDKSGMKVLEEALVSNKKYHDKSSLYKGYKDLNEWWMKQQERRISKNKIDKGLKR